MPSTFCFANIPHIRSKQLIGGGGGGGYTFINSEAETVVDNMTTTPDDTRKELIDDFVGDLKTAVVWSKMDALYVMAAATEQAATINWKAPTSTKLTQVNSPTFAADTGFDGNSSSQYLDTGLAFDFASDQYANTDMHLGLAHSTNSFNNKYLMGASEIATTQTYIRHLNGNIQGRPNGNNAIIVSGDSIGQFILVRTGTQDVQIYDTVAGTSNTEPTNAVISIPLGDVYLLAANIDGVATDHSGGNIELAHWGSALDATEVAAVDTAWDTYKAGL